MNEQNIYFSELPKRIKDLINVLYTQKSDAYLSGNWEEVEVRYTKTDTEINVRLPKQEIGFKFDLDGNFYGIWNWKE